MMAIYNITQVNSLGYLLKEVKQKVAKYYMCSNNKECDLNELVALQWGSSGVTGNSSGLYRESPYLVNVLSLQDWLPASDLSISIKLFISYRTTRILCFWFRKI